MTPRIMSLANFMKARHDIYLARVAGEKWPWTEDVILRVFRFCNVYRELDRVTIWVDKNIRRPYADHPHLWFMLAIARYINWPDTLSELIRAAEDGGEPVWPSHPEFWCGGSAISPLSDKIRQRALRGEKVYTGAYMIRAESCPTRDWYSWSKHQYIGDVVLGRLWDDRAVFQSILESRDQSGSPLRLQDVWLKFQEPHYIGWGPFMSYEVVTDLRHTRYLRRAPDIYSWANAGPGAIRGLNRLYGRELKAHPGPDQTNSEMRTLMEELNRLQEPGFMETFGGAEKRFEMRDVEHSLCEFDKYERIRLNQGRVRSRYSPGASSFVPLPIPAESAD